MKPLSPLPSIYLPESIAENQAGVADNVLVGAKSELVVKVSEQMPTSTTCMRGFFPSVFFFSTDLKGEELQHRF